MSQIISIKIPPSATTVKGKEKFGSRNGEPVIGIVLHNALGPDATVEYLRSGPVNASLHWFVLPSGEIVPLVEEKMAAFHIGRSQKPGWTNRTTIGVSVAGETPLSHPEQAAALYRLLSDICWRRYLPVEAILSEDEVIPGKKSTLESHMGQIREEVAKVLSRMQARPDAYRTPEN
jgi:N-acetyl-anhydromuramyl-L-alanine amidase AmpD